MKTKKAAVAAAARRNELHCRTYRKATPMSTTNLKDEIGLLLLFLCSPISHQQRAAGWSLFEVLLAQYLEMKYLGDRQ